jgi:hypothetical protein
VGSGDDFDLARQLGLDVENLSVGQVHEAVRAERDRRRPRVTTTRPRPGMDGQSMVASVHVGGGQDWRQTTSLQAAAAVLQAYGQPQADVAEKVSKRRRSTAPAADPSGWQREAWDLLDQVGELWFAGSWVSAALSRVRIVAAKMTDDGDEPVILGGPGPTARYRPDGTRVPVADTDTPPDEPQQTAADQQVAALVARWAGGPSGQEQILGRVGWHLGIAGDTYLVAREDTTAAPTVPGTATTPGVRVTAQGVLEDAPVDLPEAGAGTGMRNLIWGAYSTKEISKKDGKWTIDDGGEPFELPVGKHLVMRCWRPHPARFREAASAVRASLPILRELRGLTAHVGAQIDSRLAGNGLLLLPQSMTFVGSGQSADATVDAADPFIQMLMEAMVTPIKDRDSAAAVVPIVIRVPDETIGKAQYLRFGDTQLDKTAKELREEAIHRLALSLDLPQEVVTGLGQTNHWSAWQIDESAIKMHVAPVAATFCHSLTVGWLHPLLKLLGIPDAEDYLVWFDTTPLVLRPDRSGDAKELYDRAAIGAKALRRETGFLETDAPSEGERIEQTLIRIVERAPTLGPLILPLLGVNMPQKYLDDAGEAILAISGGQSGVDPIRDSRKITADERRQIEGRNGATGKTPSRTGTDKTATPKSATASGARVCEIDSALLEGCHMSVLSALSYAGKRMVFGSRQRQTELRPLQEANPYRMHVELDPAGHDVDRMLDGAWKVLWEGRDDAATLVPVLDRYVRALIEARIEHTRDYLRTALQQAGICLDEP